MGGEDRGTAMAASVVRAARTLGVSAEGIPEISRAHALAMGPRVAAFDDDHHPLFLHPGRTVLVLLRDVGCLDPLTLAAAALVESEDQALRIPGVEVAVVAGQAVADLVARVPLSGREDLAEALVTAEETVRLVALAERLDHLRHAHLRDAPAGWGPAVLAEAEAVYRQVAHRTHPRLAQRYDHWCRTFARRVSLGGPI